MFIMYIDLYLHKRHKVYKFNVHQQQATQYGVTQSLSSRSGEDKRWLFAKLIIAIMNCTFKLNNGQRNK